MPGKPVVWFEIYVQDMPRARGFYESVFGTALEPLLDPDGELEMLAFPGAMDPQGAGASGALVHMPGAPSGGGGTLVYFACEDCAVEAGRVEAAGGRVHRAKMSIGEYGFVALAYDTEGNMIGLHSMR